MAASGRSRANENKRIRQEALREQLSQQGHVQHVVEISEKLRDLNTKLEAVEIQRLKAAADLKIKLIDKYLPTEKPVEHSGLIETYQRASELTDDQLADIATGRSSGTAETKAGKSVTDPIH